MSTKLEVKGVPVRSIDWEKIVRRTFWECYLMARKDAKAQKDEYKIRSKRYTGKKYWLGKDCEENVLGMLLDGSQRREDAKG